jgi:hypothetical protein
MEDVPPHEKRSMPMQPSRFKGALLMPRCRMTSFPIFQRLDLDPPQRHTLTLAYDRGSWADDHDPFVDIWNMTTELGA